jgi:hypothetical protein
MKEGGEEWERKGFTSAVGWNLAEKGGYVIVVRITVDRITCASRRVPTEFEGVVMKIDTRWGV